MRTRRIILSVSIFMALAASMIGMALPAAQAQGEELAVITFHVVDTTNVNEADIPEDSAGIIYFEGTSTSTVGGVTFFVANICDADTYPTGTPVPTPTSAPGVDDCRAQDIYFKFELSLSWTNEYGGWYPEANVAPKPYYAIQDQDQEHWIASPEGEYCGGPTGASGSCQLTYSGIIAADEVLIGDYQELVGTRYLSNYGYLAVTTDYRITLSTSPIEEPSDCEGQYNIGAALGSVNIYGNNSAGINLQTALGMQYPGPGTWYAVQVTSGHWHQNGAGEELTTLASKTGYAGTWWPIESDPTTGCADEEGDTYYLQMTSTAPVFLRAYDTDGNFGANTGLMVVTIYGIAGYTPFPNGCELRYKVGELLGQQMVEAGWSNGWPLEGAKKIPWDPNALGGWGSDAYTRYYMLETFGGPADLGAGALTWGADLALRDSETDYEPSEWYEIQTAPFVTCVVQTDIVGHVKVYFAMDKQTDLYTIIKYFYAFRVRDTGSYLDNSGSLSYRLYEATDMQNTPPGEIPGPDGCRNFYHDTTKIGSIVIQGNDDDGTLLPTLASGSMYALDVVNGPWKDGGTEDSYNVQISDNNGGSWVDLKDYPYLLCAASADGDHIIIYLYGASGKVWRVRVDDGDSNFATNTLSIGMDVYPGFGDVDPYPKCTNRYSLTKVPLSDEQRKVPGNQSSGKTITGIIKDKIYSIEITYESKWYEFLGTTGSYAVDISDDGGVTWSNLENYPFRVCVELIGDGDRTQLYFTAQSSTYSLRVRDTDDDFLTNSNWVMFNLYTVVDNNLPPTPGGDPPPEWVVACNEKYSRPNGFISWHPIGTILETPISVPVPRMAEWIDYLRNAITFYFAWCPQHTAALTSLMQVYMDKEPLASMVELLDMAKNIQDMLEVYSLSGGDSVDGLTSQEPTLFSDTEFIGETGGESQYIVPVTTGPWDLFLVGTFDPATNFWYGGKIDMTTSLGTSDLSVMDEYQELCSTKFWPLFGIGADPYCNMMSMMRFTKIITWILLGLDFFISIWWLLKYFPGWLHRFWNIVTGNKDLITKVSEKI